MLMAFLIESKQKFNKILLRNKQLDEQTSAGKRFLKEKGGAMESMKKIVLGVLVLVAFLWGVAGIKVESACAEDVKEIKLGILPVYSYLEVFNRAKALKQYLSEKLGVNVVLIFSKDMDSYLKNAQEGKIDILFLNPPVYIKIAPKPGVREKGYRAFARAVNKKGTDKFRGIIAARVDNEKIKNLEDIIVPGLKGICTSRNSAAGFTSQQFLLANKGIDVNTLDIVETPGQTHEESLTALFRGEVDYAFFREETVDVIQGVDLKQIKILSYGEWIPEWCFCVSPNVDSEMAAKIKKAMLQLDANDPLQAEFFKVNKINSLIAAEDKDWDEYRKTCDKVKYDY
jgi:phosphate/phosphite/phosphonate ABC transporter binding protein